MSAFAILVAAILIGLTEATFKCKRIRDNPESNTILNLTNLLTLEGLAHDYCKQDACSDPKALCGRTKTILNDGARRRRTADLLDDLAGPIADLDCDIDELLARLGKPVVEALRCIVDPDHTHVNLNKVTPFQTCLISAILELNLLDTCNVQAIVHSLKTVCPKGDIHSIAASVCFCCTPEEKSVELCINLVKGGQGFNIGAKPANIPILGDEEGTNILKGGNYVDKKGDGIQFGEPGRAYQFFGKPSGLLPNRS